MGSASARFLASSIVVVVDVVVVVGRRLSAVGCRSINLIVALFAVIINSFLSDIDTQFN